MPGIIETITKIESFANMEEGWHFGEGVPPNEKKIQKAIGFIKYAGFLGIRRFNAFPGVDGEIQVTFYHLENMLELTLENDGSITIAEDEGKHQTLFREGASFHDAYNHIGEFSQQICDSSELSIESTTILSGESSPVWPLRSQTTVVSPFSTIIAGPMLAPLPASISRGFTRVKPVIQRFTGGYVTIEYLPIAESSSREALPEMNATATFFIGERKKRDESLKLSN